jgi:iron complex outermembrane receptor protein
MPLPIRQTIRGLGATLAVLAVVAVDQVGHAADEAALQATPLEEIVITAGLRAQPRTQLAQANTVLAAEVAHEAGVQHFADLVSLVPGLGYAAGTSRPRFFQLRGVGETEDYQGAPNPSVGLLIDDIDFSGIGMPATLFDLDHIEVLRGPGATVYGANALAGLIALRSRDPEPRFDAGAELTAGDHGTGAAGLALGGAAGAGGASWRIAAQRYRSDGFRRNAFLGRNDTNGQDETTVRGKFAWEPLPGATALLTLLHSDLDNGYDAWSVDNSLVTRSDRPGRDAQRSDGASLRLQLPAARGRWQLVSSAARTHAVYSFDGDWGNNPGWGANAPYDYFESHLRERRTLSQDLRYIGDAPGGAVAGWQRVAGFYLATLREADAQADDWHDRYYGDGGSHLDSDYRAANFAAYGSLERTVAAHGRLTLGLRAEHRNARYRDSSDLPFPDAVDDMLGGNLSWLWSARQGRQHYLTLSRGYKGGGFNIGAAVDPSQRRFHAESLWNLESGWRGQDDSRRIDWQFDLYYMRRQSIQAYSSRQLQPDNPLTYVFFTSNAAHGDNLGGEGEVAWRAGAAWTWSASAALGRTRYLGYVADGFDLRGRALPFAPSWRGSLALQYGRGQGWFLRADLAAQSGFYFDASDNQRAGGRTLLNLRGGWRRCGWTASLWVRNLLDRRYAVQGFYFGDEPPDFPVKLYVQNGDPRQAGATLAYALAGQGSACR